MTPRRLTLAERRALQRLTRRELEQLRRKPRTGPAPHPFLLPELIESR